MQYNANIHTKTKERYSFYQNWRQFSCFKLVSYVLMFAGVSMLAYGVKPYNWSMFSTIIFTILALYSGYFAALIWNDITDYDIDAIVHPNRPVPSGRIATRKFFRIALFISFLTFLFSFLVSLWCFLFVVVMALFVAVHNKYLRRYVNFPAYSEIFTPLQWLIVPIFGFLAIPGSDVKIMIILVFFTYFADDAHDLLEGIHDVEGDREFGVKTYATSFGEKNAAIISLTMFFISGVFGAILFIFSILTPIFFIPFLVAWTYTIYHSYNVVKAENRDRKKLGLKVGQIGFKYLLIAYDLIFLDVLAQMLTSHL